MTQQQQPLPRDPLLGLTLRPVSTRLTHPHYIASILPDTLACSCGFRTIEEQSILTHLAHYLSHRRICLAVYTCACQVRFPRLEDITHHVEGAKHGAPPRTTVICDCGRTFRSNVELSRHVISVHIKSHRGGAYGCDCGRFFPTKKILAEHMRSFRIHHRPMESLWDSDPRITNPCVPLVTSVEDDEDEDEVVEVDDESSREKKKRTRVEDSVHTTAALTASASGCAETHDPAGKEGDSVNKSAQERREPQQKRRPGRPARYVRLRPRRAGVEPALKDHIVEVNIKDHVE